MIGCLRTCVRMQPIIALYFESENELKFYNLEARRVTYFQNSSRDFQDIRKKSKMWWTEILVHVTFDFPISNWSRAAETLAQFSLTRMDMCIENFQNQTRVFMIE